MALAHPDPAPLPLTDAEFAEAVRRNIRTLLARQGMDMQDLAPLVGLKKHQLYGRMATGEDHSAWRDGDLLRVAHALDAPYLAVVAQTDEEFREALARSRCFSETDLVEGLDEIGAKGQIPGQRRLAVPFADRRSSTSGTERRARGMKLA